MSRSREWEGRDDQVKENERGHVACMEKMRNTYKILVGKIEGKRRCGIPRRRREDKIRPGLRVIGSKGVN
jgi:hypothetical protein